VAFFIGEAMKKYTVILLRPDWATNNYGTDTYMECVEAENPTKALAEARRLVLVADDNEHAEPTDYFCIALIEGEHNDLNPE
jgi:hypothetical protein